MSRKIEELVKGILTGDIKTDSLSKEEFGEVSAVMGLIKAKVDHHTVIKEEDDLEKKGQEIVDYAPNGQWKISKNEKKVGKVTEIMDSDIYDDQGKHDPNMESPKNLKKAAKEGPTLNYGKIDPERNPLSNPQAAQEAKTQRRAEIEAKAPIIDYQSNTAVKPKYYSGAAERAKQARGKIDQEAGETALETFKRRGQMQSTKKNEGTNEEQEPSSTAVERMTAKSEKEPHKDDHQHEAKEQAKAKKIKKEAEDILDMHKGEECYKMSEHGQWSIDKKD